MKSEELHTLVYKYPTKHKEGLTETEVRSLLTENFPYLDIDAYSRNIGIHTALNTESDGILTFHTDVFYGIVNTLAGRDLSINCD